MNYLLLIGFSILFVGIFFTWYQLYKIVSCDTKRRGLPHPKAISFILSGGQRTAWWRIINISYYQKKYCIVDKSEDLVIQISRYKKLAGIGIVFMMIGAILSVLGISLL